MFWGQVFFTANQRKYWNIDKFVKLLKLQNWKKLQRFFFKKIIWKNLMKIEKTHQTFQSTKLERIWRHMFLLQIKKGLKKIWKISPISWNHTKLENFGKCWGMAFFWVESFHLATKKMAIPILQSIFLERILQSCQSFGGKKH